MASRLAWFFGLLGVCIVLGCGSDSANSVTSRQIKLLKDDNLQLAMERDSWKTRALTAEMKHQHAEKSAQDFKLKSEKLHQEQEVVKVQLSELRSGLHDLLSRADAAAALLEGKQQDHDEWITRELKGDFGVADSPSTTTVKK